MGRNIDGVETEKRREGGGVRSCHTTVSSRAIPIIPRRHHTQASLVPRLRINKRAMLVKRTTYVVIARFPFSNVTRNAESAR